MTRKCILSAAIIAFVLTLFFAPNNLRAADEPTYAEAKTWWDPMENVWTPVGWKDHMFRYNVLYNGCIVASPHVILMWTKPATQKYIDKGIMLVPKLAIRDVWDAEPEGDFIYAKVDGGVGKQGWNENHQAPVLWTELKKQDFVVKQEVFAHVTGGKETQTGIEPIFAWVKYVVENVPDGIADGEIKLRIRLTHEFELRTNMIVPENFLMKADRRFYHGKLEEDVFEAGGAKGSYILETNKGVRLTCLPSATAEYKLINTKPDTTEYVLEVSFKAQKGAEAVLLLPMLSYEKDVINAEMTVGMEKSLAECDIFWQKAMETKTVVDVPDQEINKLLKYSVLQALMISERDPDSGYYTLLTGSGSYDSLWVTPTMFACHMLFDQLGYHKDVAFYTDVLRQTQGTQKAPGAFYTKDEGYFSAPSTMLTIPWLSDNGAVLYTVCKHGLITNDKEFIDKWTDAIIKSCEFIKRARAATNHNGYQGLLPAGDETDDKKATAMQGTWANGWNYKGLDYAVKLLKRINHPRAEEFEKERDEFKKVFVTAVRERTGQLKKWKNILGEEYPTVARWLNATDETPMHIDNLYYLDCGPLFLVWAGIFDANDPLMISAAKYFREDGYRSLPAYSSAWKLKLIHEISDCEACYSWIGYHSRQLNDRYRYMESMYSTFAGAISDQTFSGCESRGGMHALPCTAAAGFDLLRLAAVDDCLFENELHLLRMAPVSWFSDDYLTRFENMPTEYGPVTLKFQTSDGGSKLDISYSSKFHHKPKKTVLHFPKLDNLKEIRVNGKVCKGEFIIL